MQSQKSKKEDKIFLELKLYVVNKSRSSVRAIKDLEYFLKNNYQNQYRLEIINVLEKPELAEQDKILATPTVIKYTPVPVARIIGDLSNSIKVSTGLELYKQ